MRLAERFGMEIVNADAFCLYRGMDIGTAKPTPADRALIRHHLVNTHEVDESVDVAWYQRAAREAVQDIRSRGVMPLLTGGSGLYVQAVLDDLRFPGTDPGIRARLEAELAQVGPHGLHARLARVDPEAATKILPGNGRRIVRALEVNEMTGGPFTASLGRREQWRACLRLGWDPGVDAVDAAIAARVDEMWARGFVDEVEELRPRLQRARTAARAVGYRQILDALLAGQDPRVALQPTVAATRRLARRQRTWFRRDSRVRWAQSPSQIDEILGRLEP
jgi:tRNA dimethylallyltransferase